MLAWPEKRENVVSIASNFSRTFLKRVRAGSLVLGVEGLLKLRNTGLTKEILLNDYSFSARLIYICATLLPQEHRLPHLTVSLFCIIYNTVFQPPFTYFHQFFLDSGDCKSWKLLHLIFAQIVNS